MLQYQGSSNSSGQVWWAGRTHPQLIVGGKNKGNYWQYKPIFYNQWDLVNISNVETMNFLNFMNFFSWNQLKKYLKLSEK